MFQEPVHDATYGNVFTDAFDAWPEAADAADDQINFHAGFRGAIERLNDSRLSQ